MESNDLVSRWLLVKKAEDWLCDSADLKCFTSLIEIVPAVDAVEVVRCKDCENWDTDWCPSHSAKEKHWCSMIDFVTEPDFFCGYGERKKENAVD